MAKRVKVYLRDSPLDTEIEVNGELVKTDYVQYAVSDQMVALRIHVSDAEVVDERTVSPNPPPCIKHHQV